MRRKLKGVAINGVAPNYQSIIVFQYPGARPLYIYVKNAHVRAIPAIRAFVAEIHQGKRDRAQGLYARRGLVAAPNGVRARGQQAARTLSPVKSRRPQVVDNAVERARQSAGALGPHREVGRSGEKGN